MNMSLLDLSEIREKVALATAQGLTPSEITSRYGVSLLTLREWRRDPDFKACVEEYHESQTLAAKSLLINGSVTAVKSLLQYLNNPDVEDRLEIAAITLILEYVLGPGKVSKAELSKSKKLIQAKGLSEDTLQEIKSKIMGLS